MTKNNKPSSVRTNFEDQISCIKLNPTQDWDVSVTVYMSYFYISQNTLD